jgi:hypothetical protein
LNSVAQKIFDAGKGIFRALDKERIIHAIDQWQQYLLAHGLKQIKFIVEMPINCAPRYASLESDVFHGRSADAAHEEHLPRRLNKLLPG